MGSRELHLLHVVIVVIYEQEGEDRTDRQGNGLAEEKTGAAFRVYKSRRAAEPEFSVNYWILCWILTLSVPMCPLWRRSFAFAG